MGAVVAGRPVVGATVVVVGRSVVVEEIAVVVGRAVEGTKVATVVVVDGDVDVVPIERSLRLAHPPATATTPTSVNATTLRARGFTARRYPH